MLLNGSHGKGIWLRFLMQFNTFNLLWESGICDRILIGSVIWTGFASQVFGEWLELPRAIQIVNSIISMIISIINLLKLALWTSSMLLSCGILVESCWRCSVSHCRRCRFTCVSPFSTRHWEAGQALSVRLVTFCDYGHRICRSTSNEFPTSSRIMS